MKPTCSSLLSQLCALEGRVDGIEGRVSALEARPVVAPVAKKTYEPRQVMASRYHEYASVEEATAKLAAIDAWAKARGGSATQWKNRVYVRTPVRH